MAEVLFIQPIDLQRNSIIDGNVDIDKFLPYVKIAQQIHVQNYIGTKLYKKLQDDIQNDTLNVNYQLLLDEYIQPMLIHYAMVEYLPFAAYQIKNNGVYKHTAEYAESLTKSEIDFLVQKERDFAEYYTRRFIDFISFRQSTYPEYNTNTNDDIYPSTNSIFHGWVL
jgi:hypothetical protein